jgi:predicted DNA-binding transcriptional regulator YafY
VGDTFVINTPQGGYMFEVTQNLGNEWGFESLNVGSTLTGFRWFIDKNASVSDGTLKFRTLSKSDKRQYVSSIKNIQSIETEDEAEKAEIQKSVNVDNINKAIDNRLIIKIFYRGDDNTAAGQRTIEIYTYGLSSAGNPVIRAFQLAGDTKTQKPKWKLFRVDRIKRWFETEQKFNVRSEYNFDGDRSMKTVYKKIEKS